MAYSVLGPTGAQAYIDARTICVSTAAALCLHTPRFLIALQNHSVDHRLQLSYIPGPKPPVSDVMMYKALQIICSKAYADWCKLSHSGGVQKSLLIRLCQSISCLSSLALQHSCCPFAKSCSSQCSPQACCPVENNLGHQAGTCLPCLHSNLHVYAT